MAALFVIYYFITFNAIFAWRIGKNVSMEYSRSCIADCLGLFDLKPCKPNFQPAAKPYCEGPFQKNTTVGVDKKIIACNWQLWPDHYMNAAQAIDLKLCTHIFFESWFSYESHTNEFIFLETMIDVFSKWKNYAQEKGVKAILGVGALTNDIGIDPHQMSRVADNTLLRNALVEKIGSVVREYNFDGVHLRWSFPTCPNYNCPGGNAKDRLNLVTLVKELFEELNNDNKQLFLLLPHVIEIISRGYNLIKLVNYVDSFYVISFMFGGIWDSEVKYGSTLMEITNLTNFLRSQLPNHMHKVLMGHTCAVPTFYLAYPSSNPKIGNIVHPNKSLSQYYAWAELCLEIRDKSFSFVDNLENQKISHDTKKMIIYESSASLKAKIDFYKANGVGGMYFGQAHIDDWDNECGCGHMPMLRSMAELFNGAGECAVKDCP